MPKRRRIMKNLLLLLAFLVIVQGCGEKSDIIFNRTNLYPEGIAYDADRNEFLVTSLTTGDIGRVGLNGKYKLFISDNKLISAMGIHVDKKRDRLIVCNSDPGVSKKSAKKTQMKKASLGIYSLKTGDLIKHVDLADANSGNHFANDFTIDPEGNLFVTDSFSPVIYKVDINYRVSIFLSSPKFKGKGFNLNGIVYHPNRYLLVTKYNQGKLFKIPVDKPESFAEVQLPGTLLGADGLVLTSPKELVVVQNMGQNRVTILEGSGDWKKAAIKKQYLKGFAYPTTGTIASEKIFVLNAKLNRLFSGKNEKVDSYEIINISDKKE